MFVALKVSDEKKSFIKRIFDRKSAVVTKEKLPNGLGEYYLITCRYKKGKIDFAEVARLAGRERNRIVTEKSVVLPEKCEISAFGNSDFYRMVMINGLLDCLKKATASPTKIHITFIDRNAVMKDDVLKFLPYSVNIKVVTDKESEYRKISNIALKKYGAPVIISRNSNICKKSNIIIAEDEIPFIVDRRVLIFSKDMGKSQHIRFITPKSVKIGENIKRKLDNNFEQDYFYSAIFSLNGTIQARSLMPDGYLYMNDEISAENLVKMLKHLDN